MSGLSEELSQYTVSFNTTLLLIQDIATRAVTQDEIMNGLRTEAIAQADICIQKVNTVSCVLCNKYNIYIQLAPLNRTNLVEPTRLNIMSKLILSVNLESA